MKASESPVVFFRNDDVRDRLDHTLISMTELFLRYGIPLAHAVEPANITPEVVNWLKLLKKDHPQMINIVQHGYNHNLDNPGSKMEFGGNRAYEDQYKDIFKGKELMSEHFSDLWSPAFSFPYGTYNSNALRAISDCGYKILSSKIRFTPKSRFKNFLGRSLGKDFVFGKGNTPDMTPLNITACRRSLNRQNMQPGTHQSSEFCCTTAFMESIWACWNHC
jgi:hypothetical protein